MCYGFGKAIGEDVPFVTFQIVYVDLQIGNIQAFCSDLFPS